MEKDSIFVTLQCALDQTDSSKLGIGRDVKEGGMSYSRLQLARAWRIENPSFWKRFQCERSIVHDQVQRKGVAAPHLSSHVRGPVQDATVNLPGDLLQDVNEVRLLHGTKPDTVLMILQNGPNERFSDGLFGAGTYLAEDAGKTDQYVTKDAGFGQVDSLKELHRRLYHGGVSHPTDVYYVFVVRTVMGRFVRSQQGDPDATDMDHASRVYATENRRELAPIPDVSPPTHYHGLLGELGPSLSRYREFVQFNAYRLFPEYLLAYHRNSTAK